MSELDDQRAKITRLNRILKAIRYLTEPCTSEIASDIARIDAGIAQADAERLRFLQLCFTSDIAGARESWGVQASDEILEGLAKAIEATPEGRLVLLPMYFVRPLLRDPDRFFRSKDHLADHAVVIIDPRGKVYDGARGRGFGHRLLEQSLYEDMCVLFNSAKRLADDDADSPLKNAQEQAFCRSALTAAFNLVEAYLNGIAVDYLSANHKTVSEGHRTELSEWDHMKQKPRFLSLRDKLVRYPRIVLGAKHPPLTEGNCKELKFIVQQAKLTRDAIVHPSPAPDPRTLDLAKYTAVDLANINETQLVVDNAVSLVRKLDMTIHGSDKRVSVWLHERDKDGYFSHNVFADMKPSTAS